MRRSALDYSTPCRGHVWRRIGGSRKEYWFECGLCGETREKRLGTDMRVLRAVALRATAVALLAACALPVAAQEPEPVDLDGLVLEDGREVQAEPDSEFGEEAEAEPEPQRPRILAAAWCVVEEDEPAAPVDPAAEPAAEGPDGIGCDVGVGAELLGRSFAQGRVSWVAVGGVKSIGTGVSWAWLEGRRPVAVAVGVVVPYDGGGIYSDGAGLALFATVGLFGGGP